MYVKNFLSPLLNADILQKKHSIMTGNKKEKYYKYK